MKTLYFEKNIPAILFAKFAAKSANWLLFSGPNAVVYKENLPDPPLPGPKWLKIRNIQTGVCGTDLSFFKATTDTDCALEPMPASDITFMGHETVGVVEEIGPKVSKFKVGDKVTLREYMPCCGNKGIGADEGTGEPCHFCQEGNYCLCENYGEKPPKPLPMTGAGFGDYYLAPEQQLSLIDPALSDDQACMIEPTAVSLHAVLRAPPEKGEKVMVLGCGTIGLGIVQCLKIVQPDCEVWVMEKVKEKQDFALRIGADHVLAGNPYKATVEATGAKIYTGFRGNTMLMGGFDRIYDCVGGSWSNSTCLRLLRARGTLVKIGHHMQAIRMEETPVWWQEITLVGIDAHGMEDWHGKKMYTFDVVQELMKEGKYDITGFISHRFTVPEYKKAFKLMMENPPDLVKIVLESKY
jgi:threonine dehydrogenase-like Zn-dependent dehydrogenase